ncbi:Fatty acid synthase-like Protein [Tribolium castaneum]|uniref:oleoyl-[acyl-carrier-protein] hydrolase n=1 Tax=Tribolium castaneum TaxID=7070 RepID=D2A4P4_TRICA|nr:Fatty acid synthase-like Protein [Tribolium castaneum]
MDSNTTNFQFGQWLATPPPGEEVVVTGMSGRFPASNNVQEFRDNLFAKKYMMDKIDKRWKVVNKEIPSKGGLLPEIGTFDPGFFGIHHRQAENMDPAMRNFLEVAVEAILDSGFHPKELEGSRTGVFVGYSWSDLEAPSLSEADEPQKFGMTGYSRSFIPHRISYYLKLKGPSVVVDSACSSSFNGLEHAFKAIRTGKCDNALVGGCNLTLHPGTTLQFARYGLLSKDCICKVFDQEANGYVRSETIACVFLQKAKNSRRIYAQIVGAKINDDGFKSEGLSFPSHKMQGQLLKEIYNECGIVPSRITYMELHGTGTKVGDGEELQAVDDAIVTQREKTLIIGSVKSNIGHAEPASGMSSLIKVLIAMEEGKIAPNMNLNQIKAGFTSLEQGKLRVATEITPLEGEEPIVGISNFGFGGNNCHVILKRVSKKNLKYHDEVPRLVCVSGRTVQAVEEILNKVKSKFNVEFIAMLHQLFKNRFTTHLYRGYALVSKNGTFGTSISQIKNESNECRVHFGNFQKCYLEVCQYFMLFPKFRSTMERINEILGGGTTLYDTLSSTKTTLLASVCTQFSILETLRDLGVVPKLDSTTNLAHLIQTLPLEQLLETVRNIDSENHKFQVLTASTRTQILEPEPENDQTFVLDVTKGLVAFLDGLGRLYQNGVDLHLEKLYAPVEFPVSRATPMISPLVKWYHDKIWHSTAFTAFAKKTDAKYDIGLMDENSYLEGHVIDGRNLFPATGYLNIIWEIIAKERYAQPIHLPIVFENCKFVRATTMPKAGFITFAVSIQRKSGFFEIVENDSIVMTGRVLVPDDIKSYQVDLPELKVSDDPKEYLDEFEVYKELYLRGYNYSGLFKGLVKCNIDGSSGLVRWDNNWISFMDKMLQIKILELDSRLLYVPTGIKKLSIDPIKHLEIVEKKSDHLIPVSSYKNSDVIRCGGIEILGLQANAISKRKPILEPVLEKSIFIPNATDLDLTQAIRVNTQIILDESLEKNFTALEILDEFSNPEVSFVMPLLFNALEDIPLIHPKLTISTKTKIDDIPGVKIEATTLSSTSNLLLIVATKLFQRVTLLNQVLSALSQNGFALSREDANFEPEFGDKITILTQFVTPDEKLILFKKTESGKFNQKLINVSSENFNWVQHVKEELKTDTRVVLYSEKGALEGLLGLVNCLRKEPGGTKISCVSIMGQEIPQLDEQLAKNLAFNVYKNQKWGTYRHLHLDEAVQSRKDHAFVSLLSRGDLSSLRWVEGPLSKTDPKVIFANYCAINFKDIMTATGRIVLAMERTKQDSIEGLEYSGRDFNGTRIMGMTDHRAMGTLINPDLPLCWRIPDHWSLEDAATVPVVYSTVIYGLLMRSTLAPGTSILIHSGTGGIGLAALNVALAHGCDVYVTVGTKEKREFLRKNFPQISDDHIGNSRDLSFEEMIKTQTKGRGVDIVLNSLTEEKLRASVRCLARGGKFFEIGKFDLVNNNAIQLLLLEKGASYHGIMVDTLFKESDEDKLKLNRKVEEGIRKGYVKPIPRTVFESDNVEAAFRYMMTGKHIGKVLVKIREENQADCSIQCLPKFWADPSKSYIILGGLGGFGLELADWLVLRGARNLVLTSRTGVQTGYQTQRIKIWQSYGARVNISTITISSKDDCVKLIQEATKLAPVDAIFNLAVVLKDELFENQTEENFRISLTPKAFATKYLDQVSRDLCPNLRFFVVFSSVSCGRGNIGQSNYGMANSIMERVCEKRKSEGFPALAIQWGAIGDVGLVAKMQKDNKELVIGGTLQQKISSCLNVLDRLLNQDEPIVSSMVVAEKRDKRIGGESAVDVVAALLGIKDIKTVSQQSSLSELGMDSMMGNEVMQVLEKEFEIYVTPKDLRTMTFAKLVELEAQRTSNIQDQKSKQKMEQGTNTIIQFIPDGQFDNQELIKLERVEGVFKQLEPFVKNLNARVFGVQYSYQQPEHTIQEVVENILPKIEKHIKTEKKFFFIGYSFGVTVALELALRLEAASYTGTVVAIDGSPHYTRRLLEHYLPGETAAEFESMILVNILAIFLPLDLIVKNKEKLMSCPDFDARIETVRSFVPSDLPNLQKMDKQVAFTLRERFRAILDYKSNGNKLKSTTIKLYKAEHPPVALENMDEDYKLAEFSESKVEAMTICGNHISMLEQKELVNDVSQIFALDFY